MLYNKGVILEKLSKYHDAVEIYRTVLQLNPIYADGWNNLGYLHAKLGRLDASQSAFEQAVDLNAWSPEFNRNLGIIYLKQGKIDQATLSFENGLRAVRCLNFDRSTTRHFASHGTIQFRAAVQTNDIKTPQRFSNWGSVRFPPRPESPPEIQNPENIIAVCYDPDRKEMQLECEYNADATMYIIEYKVRGYTGSVELDPIQPVFADLWNNLNATYETRGNLSKAADAYKQAEFIRKN
ncbi:tetratricopeptide repeat protein [bacterium]|nr:tetratricopeptide repeat protein [bacterium]